MIGRSRTFAERDKPPTEKRFIRYFRAFIILAAVLCVTMTAIQYASTDSIMRQETEVNGRNTFTLLKHSHNVIFDQLDRALSSLFDNQQYLGFGDYYKGNDMISLLTIRDQLDSLKRYIPALNNICLYYPDLDSTFSTLQTLSSMELYHDADFLRGIKAAGKLTPQTYVREVQYLEAKSFTKVVTLVRALPLNVPARKLVAYLVIDLDFSSISKAFEQLVIENNGSLMIYDESDSLISVIGTRYTLQELGIDGTARSSAISLKETRLRGDTLYVYESVMTSPAWNYVYVQNISSINQHLRQVQSAIILVCAVMLLLALLYSWYVSRRLYQPIREVSVRLGDPSVDVFDRIDQMINENERLNLTLQDNVVTGRNHQLLHRALLGMGLSSPGSEALKLVPPKCECAFYLIRTHADDNALSPESLSAPLSAYGMQLIVKLYTAPCEVALIIAAEKFTMPDIEASAAEIIRLLGDTGASIGISRPFKDMDALSDAYHQAKEALGMYLTRGAGSRCCYLDIRNRPAPDYPYRAENAVLRAFRNRDMDEVALRVREFEKYIVENDCLPQYVRDFYTQLFCSCQRLMVDQKSKEINALNYSHRELLSMEGVAEMSDLIIRMLSDLMVAAEENETTEKTELIERICGYIDAHLDENPTIERLSSIFYMSPTSLRAEFTQAMGFTMKTYIDQRRIVIGKQMLTDDTLRVQDIAVKLGFQYAQSFISFFKNATGMTPGEFRAQAQEQRSRETLRRMTEDAPPKDN